MVKKKLWNQRLVGQFNSQLVMLMLLLTILQGGPPTSYKWGEITPINGLMNRLPGL